MEYQLLEPILKVQNINLQYDNKVILRNINFEIRNITRPNVTQGQVISILGRSGIGKSSLFRLLSALEKPTSGEILLKSRINTNELLPVKEGDMGVVFQNYLLFNHLTLYKNMALALKHRLDKTYVGEKETIHSYAEQFNLLEHLDKYPSQLSGGQRQRASISLQLLNGSHFILMDEPFSGLDFIVKNKTVEILNKVSLLNEYQTIIIVSHDIVSSVALSDMVILLNKEEGQEGATIVKQINLIERDLAWHTDVKEMPAFKETIKEIESLL